LNSWDDSVDVIANDAEAYILGVLLDDWNADRHMSVGSEKARIAYSGKFILPRRRAP
jgi:hypothetical protein